MSSSNSQYSIVIDKLHHIHSLLEQLKVLQTKIDNCETQLILSRACQTVKTNTSLQGNYDNGPAKRRIDEPQ